VELREGAFTEAMEKHRIVNGKMDNCEEIMEAEQEAQDAKLAVRTREVAAMETKVASIHDPVALEEQWQCLNVNVRKRRPCDNSTRKKI
jgi:hypothetical protein